MTAAGCRSVRKGRGVRPPWVSPCPRLRVGRPAVAESLAEISRLEGREVLAEGLAEFAGLVRGEDERVPELLDLDCLHRAVVVAVLAHREGESAFDESGVNGHVSFSASCWSMLLSCFGC